MLIATANARRTNMPLEYVLHGWFTNSPISANFKISSSLASISSLENPIIMPLRYTFSMPVYSMLKPAPSSSSAEILPSISTSPLVGESTPVIIFKMVDLPEPFVPMIPTVSPFFTSNVTWSSARCSLNLPFPVSPSASNSRSEGLLYSRYTLLTSSTLIANSSIQLQIPLYNTSAKCGRSLLNTVVPRNSITAVTTQKYTVIPISSQNPM